MDVKKKKKLRNKLILAMSVGFILALVWIVFMFKLVDSDTIHSSVAAASIIGMLLATLVAIFLVFRFFLGKIMTIFGGLKDMTDETMDLGLNKIAGRNDEIESNVSCTERAISPISS